MRSPSWCVLKSYLPILCAWLRVLLILCLGKSSIFGFGKDFSGKGGKSSNSTKSSSESSSDPTRSANGFRFRLKCWHKSVVQFFYEIDQLTDSDCESWVYLRHISNLLAKLSKFRKWHFFSRKIKPWWQKVNFEWFFFIILESPQFWNNRLHKCDYCLCLTQGSQSETVSHSNS